ncbi:hypothetical protein N7451_007301, partial [Penicillium sp. IBT 35674x]
MPLSRMVRAYVEHYLAKGCLISRLALRIIRAVITIKYAKGYKDRPNDNQIHYLRPLDDNEYHH